MIIAKTPFRISFFGGGTDFPEFFNSFGGTVISAAIDKYCYVSVRELPNVFPYKSIISYSELERVNEYNEIKNPVVRESMRKLSMHSLKINYDSDLPARSGLGTSSSFAVGLLGAFHHLKGDDVAPEMLAKEAVEVERGMCAEAGGWQDQVAVSLGGFNRIDFENNSFSVTPINISEKRKKEFLSRLQLYFTGKFRVNKTIQNNLRENIVDKTEILLEMKNIALKAQGILENESENLDEIGLLLDKSWQLKKQLNPLVSNEYIDNMYSRAIKSGALGGKLLGAGEGGFLLVYVPKKNSELVKSAFAEYLGVPFNFSNNGFSLLHGEPEKTEGEYEKEFS